MAYVVARPKGRFEIRESVHTAKGPRARSLANFSVLTDAVLARAAGRAVRPFDADLVREVTRRAGAPIALDQDPVARPDHGRPDFVEASRRMARSLEPRANAPRPDPGDALIDLLGFVAQISAFRPARSPEPLRFPVLARLRAQRLGLTPWP